MGPRASPASGTLALMTTSPQPATGHTYMVREGRGWRTVVTGLTDAAVAATKRVQDRRGRVAGKHYKITGGR